MIEQFHFLRPAWLLALVPLIWLLWHSLQHRHNGRHWSQVVDAELMPHLLSSKTRASDLRLWLVYALAGILVILALAGPAWERLPQPIFRQQSALVILLDLSRSMDANDIKPSRLSRARHKIADILALRKEGQTALIAYAADAFVVTPLTEDTATINAMLSSLNTEIMPAQGSFADKALLQAYALLDNAVVPNGDILLISDGFNALEFAALQLLIERNDSHRISVLGVGTQAGAPIPLASGGFLQDQQGSIVVPRLNESEMRDIAQIGGGSFQLLSANDADINALINSMRSNPFQADAVKSDLQADIWREQGPWLILLVLPLMALVFRRGVLLILPLICLPISPEALALEWNQLWQNSDQRGLSEYQKGQHESAAEKFNNPEWKASSHYRAGDYERALENWSSVDNADAFYNQGNALANLQRLEEALAAYDQALKRDPTHEDAAFNKKRVEQILQKQQQQNQQESEQKQSQKNQNQQDESQQSPSRGQDQQSDSSNQSSQQSEDSQQSLEQQSESEQSESMTPDDSEQNRQSEEGEQDIAQAKSEQDMQQQMSEQSTQQWLRKIPDDPGGLLRRKFVYQYRQRGDNSKAQEPW